MAFLKPCGFGHADVVVAVPACWIDVRRMADLEEMAVSFRRIHGRRVRVATKYMNLTRRFFSQKGVTGYRIVESFGATEGAPAAGLAELIVDITTTGTTLHANGLKLLDDGVILKSEANLVASKVASWSPRLRRLERQIVAQLSAKNCCQVAVRADDGTSRSLPMTRFALLLRLSVLWLAAAPTAASGAGGQLHLVRRNVAQAAAAQRARQVRLHGLGMELEQAGAPDLVRHADARPLESRGPEARADAGQLQALMA